MASTGPGAGNPEGGISAAGFEMLTMALETIDEAVGIYDADDRLVAFNRHYAEVRSAIGGHVALGSRWEDLVLASVRAGRIPEAIGREEQWLEERRTLRGAYSIIRELPDGRSYQVNERRMPNGGVAVVWADITRLVAAEQHLEAEQRRTFEQLLQMSRLSITGQIASMLVHEMNQPLTAIANYLSALRRFLEQGTTDLSLFARIADRVEEQSIRAAELLRRLRSFLTRHEIDLQPTDLNALLSEALQRFADGARMAKVVLEQSLADELPAARADRVLVQQVIVNLMKN